MRILEKLQKMYQNTAVAAGLNTESLKELYRDGAFLWAIHKPVKETAWTLSLNFPDIVSGTAVFNTTFAVLKLPSI
jgi:hypothetical protein